MKRWHISKDWVLVWGLTFLLGGLILYIGYLSFSEDSSLEKPQEITIQSANAISTSTSLNTGSEVNKVSLTHPEQLAKTIEHDQILQEEIKLVFEKKNSDNNLTGIEDFPSPVGGTPLRSVGNYYSEDTGNYVFHDGLDYALLEGTVIRATHGGKVVFAGQDPILGQKVILDCGEGWLITYGGLDNLRVQEGEVIETQEALGQVGLFPGTEGKADSPQLHYEVLHNGQVQRFSSSGHS